MWRVCNSESPLRVHRPPGHSDPTAPAGQVLRTRRMPGGEIPGPTAPLPLEERQEADMYTAYRASGLRSWGRRYEDALRDPALSICLKNLATAINRRRAIARET